MKTVHHELDKVLQIVMPDDFYKDMREILIPFVIKWHESKLSSLKVAAEKKPIHTTEEWGRIRRFAENQFKKGVEAAAEKETVSTDEVQEFMTDVHNWADDTFGKERTALAPLYHLKKEVDEAIEAMNSHNQWNTIEELADCFILILNSSSKYKLTFKELLDASKEKMIRNKSRQWGKPDKNGVVEHIKSQAKELSDEDILRWMRNESLTQWEGSPSYEWVCRFYKALHSGLITNK